MLKQIDEAMGFHKEVLNLRQQRQKVLASNIANADTPHYKARDFDFGSELTKAIENGRSSTAASTLRATSDRHMTTAREMLPLYNLQYRTPLQESMDGNTVEMESERARFADNAIRHQASLSFLNSFIRSMKSAMQPE